ncbi:MAG: hypothetical protein EXX96DRAFT_611330 [Benjaminiella poitrasii]|nr:MAG: hypothetical protein EXX96DRAFT_611330 [Benjaminiella poitrasii]
MNGSEETPDQSLGPSASYTKTCPYYPRDYGGLLAQGYLPPILGTISIKRQHMYLIRSIPLALEYRITLPREGQAYLPTKYYSNLGDHQHLIPGTSPYYTRDKKAILRRPLLSRDEHTGIGSLTKPSMWPTCPKDTLSNLGDHQHRTNNTCVYLPLGYRKQVRITLVFLGSSSTLTMHALAYLPRSPQLGKRTKRYSSTEQTSTSTRLTE